jgi:hypothetical protein
VDLGGGAYTAAAVSKRLRETVADWLMTAAGLLLLISLFLTWSHQFSATFLARYGPALQGVPRNPDAWQVYSTVDVLLAVLAAGLLAVAFWGGRAARLALALALVVAIVFTIHALSVPPTNGAVVFNPFAHPPRFVANGATSGAGEVVALIALLLGGAGVGLSYSVDL